MTNFVEPLIRATYVEKNSDYVKYVNFLWSKLFMYISFPADEIALQK